MNNAAEFKLIQGGLLVDPISKTSELRDILIEGQEIREIGAPGLACPDNAELIDAADAILIPGLVNAHTHTHHALGKGRGDIWSLDTLLTANPWLAGGLTLEDKYLCGLLNAAEMVLKGCTAAYDMFFELPAPTIEGMEAVARGYSDIGVRCVIAPMMGDTTYYKAIPGLLEAFPDAIRSDLEKLATAPHEEQLAACGKIFKSWPFPRDRVRPALGPTIPLHCSEAFLTGCRDMAQDYDLRVQTHLAEAKFQAIAGQQKYGKTLAGHMDDVGLIGPNFTGAHCVWLDEDDIKMMADKGASIAHNPASNLRLGSGIAPARAMRDHGLVVGIGTDGSSCSDSQNMFEAMRTASFVARILSPDTAKWLPVWDILEMATAGSAEVLGYGDTIGRLAAGYKADIVFLDKSHINYVPLNDAAYQIINCEDSGGVKSVMIDGRMVLKDRKFTEFDFASMKTKAQDAADRIAEQSVTARKQAEALEPFVAQHCSGLARQKYHVHRTVENVF